jgi:hypothetical protein
VYRRHTPGAAAAREVLTPVTQIAAAALRFTSPWQSGARLERVASVRIACAALIRLQTAIQNFKANELLKRTAVMKNEGEGRLAPITKKPNSC